MSDPLRDAADTMRAVRDMKRPRDAAGRLGSGARSEVDDEAWRFGSVDERVSR